MEDEGHAVSYKVLARGTPVVSSDGEGVGSVREVLENEREHIFDGIVINTPNGRRFVDAPEVARITVSRVTLSIDSQEAKDLPGHRGFRGTLETHAKRTGRRWKRRFSR